MLSFVKKKKYVISVFIIFFRNKNILFFLLNLHIKNEKNNLKNNQIFLREKNDQILKSRNMFKLCHLYTYSFNKRE